MTEVHTPILIVAASGRAAAAAARRCGYVPWVIDLFADADTRRLANAQICEFDEYPSSLADLARAVPAMPWVYGGGLENHPDVVERITALRECWGNSPDVLRLVRDPFRLQSWFTDTGILFPRTVRQSGATVPPRWLRKPYASGGGRGISFADSAGQADSCYWQEYLSGEPMSAIFASDRVACELLGVSHQLIGEDWLHAEPFAYCGTTGVNAVSAELESEVRRVASVLFERGGLRGVWGFDFLLASGRVVVLEVNPRYTASIEVLEHQYGVRSFDWIRWAFAGGAKPKTCFAALDRVVGKAYYFAPHDLVFPPSGPWVESLADAANVEVLGDYADIPSPGAFFPKGFPVLTCFVVARTRSECVGRLQSQAAELDQLFREAR